MRWPKISFSLQMLLAVLLGLLVGIFFGEDCRVLAPWSSAYIMILKITAVPYIILAVIQGVGQLSGKQALEILKKGFFFIALAWAINLVVIYLVAWAFPPMGEAGHTSFISHASPALNIAELIIPENIFSALSSNTVPAVVIFSLLIGIGLIQIREKQSVMLFFETLLEVLTQITKWISKITPIGTFILLAYESGTINLATVQQVGSYLVLFVLGMALLIFWMIPRFVSALTHYSAWTWIKNLFPILILGFTTSLVIVAVPYIIALVQKEIQALCPKDEKAKSQIQGTVSVIFNLPLSSLFLIVFVLFIAHLNQFSLSATDHIKLVSTTFLTALGSFGIGSWVNNMDFILDTLGLPLASIDLYLATLPFTSGFQAMVSISEITALALLTSFASSKLILWKWKRSVMNCVVTASSVILLFFVLKIYSPFSPIKTRGKRLTELSINSSISVKIYTRESMPASRGNNSREDPFNRIEQTKVLRVGYQSGMLPFCFWNKNHELVGYDIAFAYALARDLGCSLELVPLQFDKIGEELASGLYDIGMSHISFTEQRLKQMLFSEPYDGGQLVFITKDKMRKEFSSLADIRHKTSLSIAVMKGSSFEEIARKTFPENSIILIDNYTKFSSSPAQALLLEEAQAIAWSLLDSSLYVVFPTPQIGLNRVGYVIAPEANRFLHYLNEWLVLKKTEGFTEEQYNTWVYGKTSTEQPRRWSILHDSPKKMAQ